MCRIITKTGIYVKGKVLVPCEYDNIMPAVVDGEESDELFLTMKSGEMEIIKIDEKECSYKKCIGKYHNVYKFNNGIAVVSCKDKNEKYTHGLVSANLDIILNCYYTGIAHMSESLYAVYNNGKQGVYDAVEKRFIVPIEFSYVAYDEKEQKITLKI